jgi:hypothetical protein
MTDIDETVTDARSQFWPSSLLGLAITHELSRFLGKDAGQQKPA